MMEVANTGTICSSVSTVEAVVSDTVYSIQ